MSTAYSESFRVLPMSILKIFLPKEPSVRYSLQRYAVEIARVNEDSVAPPCLDRIDSNLTIHRELQAIRYN
jgi:hypothetical protein